MQAEIQKAVTDNFGDIATMTKDGMMKAVEVLQEQCPLLINEVLKWEMCKSLVWFVFGLALTLVGARAVVGIWRWTGTDGCRDEEIMAPICIGCFFLVGGPVAIVVANLTWLQIMVAPRLFLLEYLSGLI